jgi:propionate CoA-transferase
MSAKNTLPGNLPLEERFTYDSDHNRFYVNFQNFNIDTIADIYKIEFLVAENLSHLEKRVSAIVNYENFTINEDLLVAYSRMVNRLMEHFYSGVSRYTSSGDLKSDLEKGFKGENIAPNIFGSSTEAESALEDIT